MIYIDTYISSPSQSSLENFASNFLNNTPVSAGVAEIIADLTNDPPIDPQPAKGDPNLFYVCIRSSVDISALVIFPFSIVDQSTGASIVGVFA